jgi:hypothetical protein
MLLKNITELDVLKIENPITIRQADAIVIGNPDTPVMKSNEIAGIVTAKILGMYAIVVDLSSPIFDIIFGAIKKINNIVAV